MRRNPSRHPHLGRAEYLVHVGDVGPQRRVRVGGVVEDRFDADELTHVRAVVLDADGLAAGPVHHDRRRRARPPWRGCRARRSRPRRSGCSCWAYRDGAESACAPASCPAGRRAPRPRPVGRADADDRERDVVLLRDPGAHGLGGDLGEAVVRAQRHARRVGSRSAAAAPGTRRSSRSSRRRTPSRRGSGTAARRSSARSSRRSCSPVAGAGVDGRVEHVGEIVGKRREVAGAHVERDRGDSRGRRACRGRRVPQSGGAPDLVALRQRPRDREGDLARSRR